MANANFQNLLLGIQLLSSIFAGLMKTARRVFLLILLATACVLGYFAYGLFGPAFGSNAHKIRIRSGWTLETLTVELSSQAGLIKPEKLRFWLPKLGYKNVKPCTIEIPGSCSIYQLADILKSNRYQTTNITLLGSMEKSRLGRVLAEKLEIDSAAFVQILDDSLLTQLTGFNDTSWPALFIPNTYNFAVSTDLNGFLKRMKLENDKFWNPSRIQKAKNQGLSPIQVMIIASIVTKESNKTSEYENIAGVYINRFRKGMKLQADPTIVFAKKKAGRVLNNDLKIESPYNTYEHAGLPPGPIAIPNEASIMAVLNYTSHNYLYFVANYTFDGFHHFSPTLAEHNLWAAKLHAAMNKRAREKASSQ